MESQEINTDNTDKIPAPDSVTKKKRGRPRKNFAFPIAESLAELGNGINLNELDSATITDEFLERRLAYVVLSLEKQIGELEAELQASTKAIEAQGGTGNSDLIRHRTSVASNLKTTRSEHAKAVLSLSKSTGFFSRQNIEGDGETCEHCGGSGGNGIRVIVQAPETLTVQDAPIPPEALDIDTEPATGIADTGQA